MGNASTSLAACLKAIDAGESELVLDGLAHSDSSAVAVLLAALRRAGRPVRLTGMPDSVRSLARLYGVDGLVDTTSTGAPA